MVDDEAVQPEYVYHISVLTVALEEDKQLHIDLSEGMVALHGHLRDACSGDYLSGGTVEILDGPNAGRSTLSNNLGEWEISDLFPGTFTIRASSPPSGGKVYLPKERVGFYVVRGEASYYNDLLLPCTIGCSEYCDSCPPL